MEELLATSGAISVQVLTEFAAVGKRKPAFSLPELREVLGIVRTLCVTHPLTLKFMTWDWRSQSVMDFLSTIR